VPLCLATTPSAIGPAIRCNGLGAACKITEYGGADLSQCCRSTAMRASTWKPSSVTSNAVRIDPFVASLDPEALVELRRRLPATRLPTPVAAGWERSVEPNTRLARAHPKHVAGIHLATPGPRRGVTSSDSAICSSSVRSPSHSSVISTRFILGQLDEGSPARSGMRLTYVRPATPAVPYCDRLTFSKTRVVPPRQDGPACNATRRLRRAACPRVRPNVA
jgi:hypothetical protein